MHQMENTKTAFDYLEIPPHSWADTLSSLKASGAETVTIRVPWGAHENVQGMRDFSRSSRLRLERLLKSVSENQLKAEISFGFFSAKEMIPSWAFTAKKKTRAPSKVWNDTLDGFSLIEVPSLFDPDLWKAFQEFCDEVVRLSSLYLSPEGPVEKVQMDLELFALDCEMFSSADFLACFHELYPTIDSVNSKYNVTLKNTPPISSQQNFRVLYKSRPWLASFDYKLCREQVLKDVQKKALAIPSGKAMTERFEVSLYDRVETDVSSTHAIAIDPVFLEFSAGAVFPFCPEGMICPQSAYAFRTAEYFLEKAVDSSQRFFALPLIENRESGSERFITVICGKYLTRAAYRFLEKVWMRGAQVHFPFGFPQFDEDMNTFEWTSGLEKKTERVGDTVMQYFVRGLGQVWAPIHPFPISQNVWEKMETIRVGIEAIGKSK